MQFSPLQTQKVKLTQTVYYNKKDLKTTSFDTADKTIEYKYFCSEDSQEFIKLRNIIYFKTKELLPDDYNIFINYKKLNVSDFFLDKQKDNLVFLDTIFVKSNVDLENKTVSYSFYASMSKTDLLSS